MCRRCHRFDVVIPHQAKTRVASVVEDEAIRVDRSGTSPWQRLNEASAALDNGMRALQTYFRKYGTDIEIEPFVSRIVGSLDKFCVLG